MSLKGIAQETLAILDNGGFVAESGAVVNFAAAQKRAEKGTTLYRPDTIAQLFDNAPGGKTERVVPLCKG
jgi:hypothetical protein